MRTRVLAIILCLLLVGCSRDLTEYELDEGSFGADTITKIETESGIDLPDDATGLKFFHIPPVDPIVFAKIKLGSETAMLVEEQIEALTYNGTSFPEDFANDRCEWWPSAPKSVVVSNQAFNNGYYIEVHLVQEEGHYILYLKYFTI